MRRFQRLYQYQRERFPLAATALLVGALSLASVTYAQAARLQVDETVAAKGWLIPVAVAFFCALGFFFQLRVADEFKDYAEDLAYRPYRPVPRGLVTLRELTGAAATVAAAQALLAWLLAPSLLGPLLLVWGYIELMRVEFFAPAWLKAHPLVYLLSHMVILPLIVFFVTACDWLVAGAAPPAGLGWLLGLSFANGLVFELGRKIRAAPDEEPGVQTYSALWGPQRAVAGWLAALTVAVLVAGFALRQIHIADVWNLGLLSLVWCGALVAAWRFGGGQDKAHGNMIERYAAVAILATYVTLAASALLARQG
ncbi:MAG: hypothetical protein DCC55_13860 [Chloroflexi bacterium]|nr:MAG: hypothetical protein DCC55_13860 [Chloroflexota bacterium]